MTSKTSLFNKGIYKTTLRRFAWGSVLYAILLFMITGMAIMMSYDTDTRYLPMVNNGAPLILEMEYLMPSVIIAFFVPTVVALLVYRFIHSKKTSVFAHSLPVSRNANYISTLLAGFTLMALPVILNGVILMIMSITVYGGFFDIGSCLIWIGVNLLCQFLMFSVATFSAMITGNSFALIVLNGLIHAIALIFTACFMALSYCFLYGFPNNNELLETVAEKNFIGVMVIFAQNFHNSPADVVIDWLWIGIMVACAVLFYVFGWLLYRKRRMETAEDIAAYKCLNPIYKYLVTFIATLGVTALFTGLIEDGMRLPYLIVAIISIVAYFAIEMMLKKSMKIWKSSYKGYLAFTLVFALMLSVFSFTSFFGYETRVPDAENIEEAALFNYYYQEDVPYVANGEIIEYITEVHKDVTAKDKIYTVKSEIYTENYSEQYIHIRYKLKNGSEITRRYSISTEKLYEIMEKLYKYDEYKVKTLEIFSENIGEIYSLDLRGGEYIYDKEKINEFYSCLKEDVMALDYTQLECGSAWSMYIGMEYIHKDDMNKTDKDRRGYHYINVDINANFTNTVKWLKDNGYGDYLFTLGGNDLCVLTAEQWEEYHNKPSADPTSVTYYDDIRVDVAERRTFVDITGAVKITDEAQKQIIADFVTTAPMRYYPGMEYSYFVCSVSDEEYVTFEAGLNEEDGKALLELLGM